MWTIFGITITASAMTLKSMHSMIHAPTETKIEQSADNSSNYIVLQAEHLPYILNSILQQLHKVNRSITLEIIYLPTQVEFIINIPSSIQLTPQHQQLLIPIESFWSNNYNSELLVDDSDLIQTKPFAHQIIIKPKTHNIAFVTTRSIKKTPGNYIVSGIDSYKWEKYINRTIDNEPEITTHDRIFNIIQDKLMTF